MESKETYDTREVAIIATAEDFEADEAANGDTEITIIQVNENDILTSTGEGSSQTRTLLGRLEDGRIIISQSGDHVTMVEDEMVEVEEGDKSEPEPEVEEEFASSGTKTITTTFITESGETIEVLTTTGGEADNRCSDDEDDEGPDDMGQNDGYSIQMPANFRFTLLKTMFENNENEITTYCDLPIFCNDGVAYSSKFLLSAASTFVKDALVEAESGGSDVCLIMPDVCRSDFAIFHSALFAAENDDSINAYVVIRTAEILGIVFPLTTNEDSSNEPMPTVDYSSVLGNAFERKRLYVTLGYIQESSTSNIEVVPKTTAFYSTSRAVQQLATILDSNSHACKTCKRSFVDEQSLNRHFAMLHSSKTTASVLRNGQTYQCRFCDRNFGLSINLKKHVWLSHPRSRVSTEQQNPKHSTEHHKMSKQEILKDKLAKAVLGPLSTEAAKEVKRKEKFEDMSCKACNFVAFSWKQLQIHIMDHTKERPYKCDVCQKGFKEIQKLQRHKIIHTGVREFKCQFCGKEFGLLHNMKSHERIHIGKGHVCGYCGRIYSQITTLKYHIEEHRKKGHIQTTDEKRRNRQKLNTSGRGRPSLAEVFEKKKREAALSVTASEIIMERNDVIAEESDDVTRIESDNVTRIESDVTRMDSDNVTRIESGDVTRIESDDVTRRECDRRPSDIIERCLDVANISASENDFIMPHD